MVADDPESFADLDGHCEVEGAHHNWLWCGLHSIGVIQTQHELAEAIRERWAEAARNGTQLYKKGQPVNWDKLSDKEVRQTDYDYHLANLLGQVETINQVPTVAAMVPMLDATGKVHGELPNRVPDNWTRQDMEQAADSLRQSIKMRQEELIRLGEEGAHRARIELERQLLRQIEKKLGGS